MLDQRILESGQWVTYTATVNDRKVQACQFRDLKLKNFVSTCSLSIAQKCRKMKHHGLVPNPCVAEEYLKNSASVDVHNHYCTGSVGLEHIWHTKNPHRWQLAGILGFFFTNSYMAMKYFSNPSLPHHQFKMAAANALVEPGRFMKIMRQPCMRLNAIAAHLIATSARLGMALMVK